MDSVVNAESENSQADASLREAAAFRLARSRRRALSMASTIRASISAQGEGDRVSRFVFETIAEPFFIGMRFLSG